MRSKQKPGFAVEERRFSAASDPAPTARASESVSQPFFRSSGARSFSTFHPRLAPWAAFLRRSAAKLRDAIPLSRGTFGCDTDSTAPHFLAPGGPAEAVPCRKSIHETTGSHCLTNGKPVHFKSETYLSRTLEHSSIPDPNRGWLLLSCSRGSLIRSSTFSGDLGRE